MGLLRAPGRDGSGLIAAAFRRLAQLRDAKALHPKGTVHEATVHVTGGPLPLGEHRAIVRLSRGLGLPDALPDVVGLAIRLVDLDQDLLLSGLGRDAAANPQTSIARFEAGGRRFLYHAAPEPGGFRLRFGDREVATLSLGPQIDTEEPRFDVWRHTGAGVRPTGWINRLRRRAYPESQRGWAEA